MWVVDDLVVKTLGLVKGLIDAVGLCQLLNVGLVDLHCHCRHSLIFNAMACQHIRNCSTCQSTPRWMCKGGGGGNNIKMT
jgi:hypothetical protein